MSVLALFGAVKNLLSPKSKGADINTNAFRVTRWMGVIMVVCSILTSSKQFFGEPIQCKPTYFSPAMFNSYCFMTGTITAVHEVDRSLSRTDAHAHPGVSATLVPEGRTMRHNYYQWVPFILFLQAVLYYSPYRLWKLWEGGKVGKLLVKISSDPLTEVPLEAQVEGMSKFLASNPHWYVGFARRKFICELAIPLVSVLQMYLLDLVFDGQYFGLGHEFMSVNFPWEHYWVVEEVFPLMTNCEMKYIGSAGTTIQDSGLCVLSINILNQKIFIMAWYLQILIVFFSSLNVLLELLLILVPSFRYWMLRSYTKSLDSHVLGVVHTYIGFPHYTLLVLLSKNMDAVQFEKMLELLASKIHSRRDQYMDTRIVMDNSQTAGKYGGSGDYLDNKQSNYIEDETTLDVRMRKDCSPPCSPPCYKSV